MWPGVTTSRCGCDVGLSRCGCFTALAWTSAATFSAFACGTGFWPTTATGAVSHRPTQGAWQDANIRAEQTQATPASSSREPAISHAMESQTRTVIAGGAAAVLHHVEVVIERGHFVDFGHRHASFRRRARPGAARRGSRSDPESCADARSADPADAGLSPRSASTSSRASGSTRRPFGAERARLSAFLVFGTPLFYILSAKCGVRDRPQRAGPVRPALAHDTRAVVPVPTLELVH